MNSDPVCETTRSQKLIAEFHHSVRQRFLARTCVVLLLLGVIGVSIGLMWAAIVDFRDHRTAEFATALNNELANIAPDAVDNARAMLQRLIPRYEAAFQEVYEKDADKVQALAMEQLTILDAYAQSQWPAIEAGILDVVSVSQKTLDEELNKHITPEQATNVVVEYGEALQKTYDRIFAAHVSAHIDMAKEIGANLEKIAASEPDIIAPADMEQSLGMFLELAGRELQKGIFEEPIN